MLREATAGIRTQEVLLHQEKLKAGPAWQGRLQSLSLLVARCSFLSGQDTDIGCTQTGI